MEKMKKTILVLTLFVLSTLPAIAADKFFIASGAGGIDVYGLVYGNGVAITCTNTTSHDINVDLTNGTLWLDGVVKSRVSELGSSLIPAGQTGNCGSFGGTVNLMNGQVKVQVTIQAL